MEIFIDPIKDCVDATTVRCPISKISGRSQMCITKQSLLADNSSTLIFYSTL